MAEAAAACNGTCVLCRALLRNVQVALGIAHLGDRQLEHPCTGSHPTLAELTPGVLTPLCLHAPAALGKTFEYKAQRFTEGGTVSL